MVLLLREGVNMAAYIGVKRQESNSKTFFAKTGKQQAVQRGEIGYGGDRIIHMHPAVGLCAI
jgi:hypothetical protein